VARKRGFPYPPVQGMAVVGATASVAERHSLPDDGAVVRRLQVRLTAPVNPTERLLVRTHQTEEPHVYRVEVSAGDRLVLTDFEIEMAEQASAAAA